MVEALIVISLGIAVFIAWAQLQARENTLDIARDAGRAIATYARAASILLAENPPTADTVLSIADMQDCNDPNARQYLPCSINGETTIPYATDSNGAAVTYSDLRINVTVSPAGAAGTIDFGTFRHGDDLNGDDLPDSRPDLAAIALTEANEGSGAGVLGFYVIEFRRDNPDGLIYDTTHSSFDQSEIDALAGLQARLGSLVGETPFLRLDGSNTMTGAITFNNRMSISPIDDDLVVTGDGDLSIDETNIVSTGDIQAASVDVASASISDVLSVVSALGAQGDGFQHLDQQADIVRIDSDIVRIDRNIVRIDNDVRALTGDVRSNSLLLGSVKATADANKEKINSHATELNALKEKNGGTSPATCSPSRGTLISEKKKAGYHYNTHEDWECRTVSDWCKVQHRSPSTGITGTYQVRNTLDLKCVNRTIVFYNFCSVTRNDDCIR